MQCSNQKANRVLCSFFITIGAFFPAKNYPKYSAYPHVLPFLTGQLSFGRLCTAFCCVSLRLQFDLNTCSLFSGLNKV